MNLENVFLPAFSNFKGSKGLNTLIPATIGLTDSHTLQYMKFKTVECIQLYCSEINPL